MATAITAPAPIMNSMVISSAVISNHNNIIFLACSFCYLASYVAHEIVLESITIIYQLNTHAIKLM